MVIHTTTYNYMQLHTTTYNYIQLHTTTYNYSSYVVSICIHAIHWMLHSSGSQSSSGRPGSKVPLPVRVRFGIPTFEVSGKWGANGVTAEREMDSSKIFEWENDGNITIFVDYVLSVVGAPHCS